MLDPHHPICLLDEPSAFLSENLKEALKDLLRAAGNNGKYILMATHDVDMISAADRYFYIEDHTLFQGNSFHMNQYKCSQNPSEKVISGKMVTLFIPQPLLPDITDPEYGKRGNKEFPIYKNGRIAVCGSNGAGKTTLGKYVLGSLKNKVRPVMMRQSIETQLFTSTVLDELLVGTDHSPASYDEAMKSLQALQIEDLAAMAPQFISGGEKRIILTLCMVMQHPDVLILDEVFDSVDEHKAELLMKYIDQFQQSSGCCCIFIDQNVDPRSQPIDMIYNVKKFCLEE